MAKIDKRFKYQSDDEKPVTISLRLPKELHTRLVRYAMAHRQPISELVRDGVEWRLSQDDPRSQVATLFHDDTTVLQQTLQQMIDERVQTALEAQRPARQEPLAPTLEARAPTGEPREALDFDETKYVLGKLCPHGHEYQQSGQSLRRLSTRDCYQCHLNGKRAQQRPAAQQKAATSA